MIPRWLRMTMAALIFALPGSYAAEQQDALYQTILKELHELKAGQQALLEGQQRLSEEHKQIRYWVHRKG